MKKTTIVVMIVTIIAKLFGFARDRIISYFFGVGVVSDAFMLAFGVPSLVLTVVAAAFVTGFIPMYTRVKQESEEEANDFVNNIFNIMISFALVLGIFMFLFPNVMVKIAAVGFDQETNALAASFVRVISVSVISVAIIQLGTGYLNVNESFVLPNLISIPSNIIIITTTILSYKAGTTSIMPYGALAGYLLQGAIIYLYMRKYGFRYRMVFNFKDPHLIKMVTLAGPLLISTAILSLQDLIMMSSSTFIHGKGGYSYIMMSTRLMGFATGLFVTGILSVAYPTIANAASKHDKRKVVSSMNDAILLISLFIIPATVGFMTLSYEIVTVVYGGGKVGPEELEVLSNVFRFAAVGLFFIALKDLFMRIHYAYQDSMTPLYAQIINSTLGILLFFVLGFTLGIKGLTLALSISALTSASFLFISLLKKFERLGMIAIIKDLVKIIFSAFVMGVVILLAKNLLTGRMSDKVMFLILLVAAVFTYGGMTLGLKVEVLYDLFDRTSA